MNGAAVAARAAARPIRPHGERTPSSTSSTASCASEGTSRCRRRRPSRRTAWRTMVRWFLFTDAAKPVEIAFFDRGPVDAKELHSGGYWSAYWYNGAIYRSEIARGIDVFKLKPSEHLSQNEIDAATVVRVEELNTQQQARIVWPASSVVALAYVDQLTRNRSMPAERARAVKTVLERLDGLRTGKENGGGAILDQADALA